MGGYVVLDKNRVAPASNIVAIVSTKDRRGRATVIFKKSGYLTKTSAKKITERLEGSG